MLKFGDDDLFNPIFATKTLNLARNNGGEVKPMEDSTLYGEKFQKIGFWKFKSKIPARRRWNIGVLVGEMKREENIVA